MDAARCFRHVTSPDSRSVLGFYKCRSYNENWRLRPTTPPRATCFKTSVQPSLPFFCCGVCVCVYPVHAWPWLTVDPKKKGTDDLFARFVRFVCFVLADVAIAALRALFCFFVLQNLHFLHLFDLLFLFPSVVTQGNCPPNFQTLLVYS